MELPAGNWEISGPGGLFEENFTHFHAYGIKSCHYEVNTLQMKNNAFHEVFCFVANPIVRSTAVAEI
ncbi:MAG: hypothetical protein O7D30_10860, partial [Rickettsia endosymbiont of Ixodes persulcatus]|nr:hypothetical protein [Rickettsia endosymbiont of Ixodes persulcatus]